MKKKLAFLLAASLLAVASHASAQDTFPGGSQTQPSAPDCTDPLLAGSSQCTAQNQIQAPTGAGATGATSGQNGIQQPSATNYTDIESLSRQNAARYPFQQYLPPEPLTEFQRFVASTTGQILPVYGANLFRRVPSTFAPLDMTPVPPDYIVGPGDELRVRVWGQINFPANVRVDRSGEIYLPQIGPIHVAGLPFSALDSHLRAAIGRVYRNFDLTVDVGQIRSIQVYLAGEARRPGVYTVSSLSTLVDALFASGGPSPSGSLRRIEVRRAGTVVTEFDLYALLVHGDKTKDVPLQSGDVIFIPPVGPQVALTGSVRNPGIYELRSGEALSAIVADAGGASVVADQARITIERIHEHSDRAAMEVAWNAAGLATPLADGDLIRIFSILPKYQKTVTLRGNTANQGRFAWHPGMRLSELIPDKASLITRNYWWKRAALGLPSPEFEPLESFPNLHQPNTPIELPRRGFLGPPVRGNAPITPSEAAGSSMIVQGGPSQNSYGAGYGQYANDQQNQNYGADYSGQYDSGTGYYDPTTGQYSNNPNNNGLCQYDQNTGQYYYPGQNYGVNSPAAGASGTPGANQGGAANAPYGNLPPGQMTSDAILARQCAALSNRIPQRNHVGPIAPDIDWDYAVIERLNPETLKTELIPFDLGALVLQHDASADLTLQAGDVVTVFSQADIRTPVAHQTKFVRLDGEFVHSGVYTVEPGETLRQLVEKAGGFTPGAYLYGSEFTRESTRVLQQTRMDQYVQQLQLQMQRGALAFAASPGAASQGITATPTTQTAQQELIGELRRMRATGRIVLEFKAGSSGVGSLPDITLEDGDRFIVPSRPSSINVVGAVYDQNSFLYAGGRRAGSYLRLAGGPDRDADAKHIFIIRADGSVISREAVNGLWGNEFDSLRMNPGDTIVVPEKPFKPSGLLGFLQWAQLFSSFALGAAALSVIQ